ncbi:phosphatase PAP2 family protein [Reichenbachiella sp. MALMAid0571]|uniref:phosphatase PAP2 family protein n=1 Tax=Reichenbachiella sp. MALMAid0571 TaxID=3143939 RepID=UPI0032DEF32A
MEKGLNKAGFYKFDLGVVVWATILSAIYLLIEVYVTGYRPDHLGFLVFYLVGFFAHPSSRKFVLGFSFFFVYAIIFDSMKGYPNYLFSDVRIEEPYMLEKLLFGIDTAMGRVTPNEYFLAHSSTFLDVMSGSFYINWMPIPLGFGIYLWVTDKRIFIHFSVAFFTVNILGWIIYYTYPAAPPWYVQVHGFEEHFDIPGGVAGLVKFDDFFGITLFQDLYSKGSNVFAAMPSLHSAYPVVVFFYGIKKRVHWLVSMFFGIFVVGIWFAAIYTSHHYTIDVIAGASCSIAGIFIFEKFLTKGRSGQILERLVDKV